MWELGHFVRLLLKGNPNIIGMLWTPQDCVYQMDPTIGVLISVRHWFISKQMGRAYFGWVHRELRNPNLTPKQLSHIPRLLWELEGALVNREVPIRLNDDHLQYVRDIRAGIVSREDVEAFSRGFGWTERVIDALPDAPYEWANDWLISERRGALG
jgi:hypothetical protein